MSEININVAGDVFLGGRIESIAEKNPKSLFDKKIINLFSASNLNIVNLESPLTKASEKEKLIKTGPNLKAYPETIGALKELKVDLVTLANNHIYDYGKTGLTDTLQLLKNHGIKYVGAGLDLKEANKFFLEKINGITIAILNIAENEWCNANDDHGGANPMDIIANIN